MISYLTFAVSLIDQKSSNIPTVKADSTTLQKALTLTFVIIGAISLMLMVIAGFRYVISAGDANKIAETKRMIIYTAVGLILSASAATIVNLVLSNAK